MRINSVVLSVGLAAVLWIAGCSPATSTSGSTEGDAIATTLTQLDEEWSKAAVAKDIDRVASFYAPDAVAYPPSQVAATGATEARHVWERYFADPTFSISWKTTRAGGSGDLGFTSGTYEDSYTKFDGITVRETGKYLCIWKKQPDGSWKATHDMWNLDSQ